MAVSLGICSAICSAAFSVPHRSSQHLAERSSSSQQLTVCRAQIFALEGQYTVRLPTPLGIGFEEVAAGQPQGVVIASLVEGGNAFRDGRLLVGDKLIKVSAVVLGGDGALLSVGGGTQYTSWTRELIPCGQMDFDNIMSAIGSNSGRFGYVDAVLVLQHTQESVPRPPLPASERSRLDSDGEGLVDWDWGGTKNNGISTPIRPKPDNF
mmetsp:Transcript_23783/g.39294  ORF Transcript_23783/g.39294 Transcript_23783/m.39294 type:complete len:209 (+) Transcript_23783:91-717(+)